MYNEKEARQVIAAWTVANDPVAPWRVKNHKLLLLWKLESQTTEVSLETVLESYGKMTAAEISEVITDSISKKDLVAA